MSNKKYCCSQMESHAEHQCAMHPDPFDCPDNLIYRSDEARYGIIIHDGASSFIEISFCPWCGKKLKSAEI